MIGDRFMRTKCQTIAYLGWLLFFIPITALAQEQTPDIRMIERVVPAQIDETGKIIKPQQPLHERLRVPSKQTPSQIGDKPSDLTVLNPVFRDVSRWERGPSVYRSVVARGGVWYTPKIPVCWESLAPDFAEARKWTERAVITTWEEVSDADFTGWGACADTDGYGIHIQVADTGPNVAEIGRQLDGLTGGMTLNFTFQNWGQGCIDFKRTCIELLAIHEFGHALGLAHEHNREDRTACDTEPQGPMPAYVLTAYDPKSVMNYCSEEWINSGTLSELDVYGIRAIYGPFTDDTPMHIAHTGSVDFTDADNKVIKSEVIGYDAFLTRADPLAEKSFKVCNGDDLLVEITSRTELPDGSIAASVATVINTYTTQNCAPGGELIDQHMVQGQLPQPGDGLFSYSPGVFEVTGEGYGRGVRASLTPNRVLGREVSAETCTSCVAAAERARFGTGDLPISFSSQAFHGPEANSNRAASPWPGDFKIDLDVCRREAQAGPSFANAQWTEANLARLCEGAPTSREPARCFSTLMREGLNYGGGRVWNPVNALNLCAGSKDTGATLDCFRTEIEAGRAWPSAISSCKAP